MIKALSWLFFDDDEQAGFQGELVSETKGKEEPRRPAENISAAGEGPAPSPRAGKLRPIRWGVVGTGTMALEMSQCLKNHPNCELVAVAPWNTQEPIPSVWKDIKVYSLMLDLLRNADIDVVYIATPSVLHTNHCMLAMQQGRHVVCEPPLSLVESEAHDLLELARQRKLFLMEAIPLRFAPAVRKVQELLRAGAIGPAKLVHAECGRIAPPLPRQGPARSHMPDQWCDDSALIPMGLHALSLVALLYGDSEPSQIGAVGEISEDGRVDTQVSIALQHGPGQLGSVCCSTFHDLSGEARIYGVRGSILIPRPFWCPERLILSTLGSDGCTKNEFYHFPAPATSQRKNSPISLRQAASTVALAHRTPPSGSFSPDTSPSPSPPQSPDVPRHAQSSSCLSSPSHNSPRDSARRGFGGGLSEGEELHRHFGRSLSSPLYIAMPQNGLPEPDAGAGSEPITPVMGHGSPGPPGAERMERGGGRSGTDDGIEKRTSPAVALSRGASCPERYAGGEGRQEGEANDLNTYGMQFLVIEVHRCLREGLLQSPWAVHAQSMQVLRSLNRVRSSLGLPTKPREVIGNRVPSLSDWGKFVVESPPTSPQRPMRPGMRPVASR